MRIPPVRITIARMMAAVAIIALLLGAVAILRHRAHFQRLADFHAQAARQIRPDRGGIFGPDGAFTHLALGDPKLADYHQDMAGKYERAARKPGLPVAPDPPAPIPLPELTDSLLDMTSEPSSNLTEKGDAKR
jgi:hypothetical protein